MDDHNIGEGVRVIPIWKHNYEEPDLAQQIDQILPVNKHVNYKASNKTYYQL